MSGVECLGTQGAAIAIQSYLASLKHDCNNDDGEDDDGRDYGEVRIQ